MFLTCVLPPSLPSMSSLHAAGQPSRGEAGACHAVPPFRRAPAAALRCRRARLSLQQGGPRARPAQQNPASRAGPHQQPQGSYQLEAGPCSSSKQQGGLTCSSWAGPWQQQLRRGCVPVPSHRARDERALPVRYSQVGSPGSLVPSCFQYCCDLVCAGCLLQICFSIADKLSSLKSQNPQAFWLLQVTFPWQWPYHGRWALAWPLQQQYMLVG